MRFRKYFLILNVSILCLSIAGVGNAKVEPAVSAKAKAIAKAKAKTKLTEEQVLLMARQIAEKNGIKLTDFREPEAHYELVYKDQSWVVFFIKKIMSVDGDIMIIINDRTGESYLHHGG